MLYGPLAKEPAGKTLATGLQPTSQGPATPASDTSKPDKPPEHVMFSPESGLEDTFRENMPKLTAHLELTEQQATEMRANHAQLFRDLDIVDVNEARNLHTIFTGAVVSPATDEQVETWEADSRRLLAEEYGKDGIRLLQKARKIIASKKDLASMLQSTGLGSHPRYVRAMLGAAGRQLARGK